jgi:outer membrane immunogenic protein
MKKAFLMGAALAVLAMAPAVAADLAIHAKAPALIPVPVYNWTGCYIGVHGGGGAMNDSHTNSSNFEGSSGGNSALHGTGGLAGGQAGCNYQMTNVVFGVEGEGYWSGMKGTFDSSQNFYSGRILDETRFTHNA